MTRYPRARMGCYGRHNMGWFAAVAGAVSAAKGLISSDPELKAIKDKLDKFSVGKQLTKAVKKLVGGDVSASEKIWDAYKKVAGTALGSTYDEKQFAEALKGAFDTNRNALKGDREEFMAQLAGVLVEAVKQGKITGPETASQVYTSIVLPWMKAAGKIDQGNYDKNRFLALIITDVIDRYLNNLPITRADMPSYGAGYNVRAPVLLVALEDWLKQQAASQPQPSAPGPTAPPAATVPATPAPPSVPVQPAAPVQSLPPMSAQPYPPVVAPDRTPDLIASLLAQGASQQDAFTSALQSLQANGIAPTPQVQAQVAADVKAASNGKWWPYAAGAGLVLLALLAKKRKR